MSLLLLFARRRAKRNSGHAEIEVTQAVGRGRLVISPQLAAGYLPQPRVIRGRGAAAIAATEADGAGRLVFVDEEMLIRLLMSAA